ncbi:MAG: hypothetical protein KU37_08625 [Sulfuricurvum sp. PC08-66]|nr:MAG: hypothetical protein KU37_08625 [Sulfuricurvum sp. PC08-66]
MPNDSEAPFTSKLVRTSNVPKELIDVAHDYNLDVHKLDFRIIKSELFISKPKADGKEGEFEEVPPHDKSILESQEMLLNPDFHIKQMYDIEIFPSSVSTAFDGMHLNISGNKSLTSVYALIEAGSTIQRCENISQEILHFFNRRKLRARILIDIWDKEMVAQLNTIAAKVEINGSYTFEHDTKILVSQSLNSKSTVNDKLELHFEAKKQHEDEHGKVDHKSRSYVTSVLVDELLITYTKPQAGTNGRDCRGRFVQAPEAVAANVPKFDVDVETIEIREDEEKIEYRSKKNGYIAIEGGKYTIKEELEVKEISFKATGNVNAGTQGDIAIRVRETDAMKDAIGMGVEVEAKEVIVEGNVGPNSTVRAQNIEIGGQTHQTSSLYAPTIKVNLHRGYAKGTDVQVKRLEQGKIVGETVYVEQAMGGEIYGKHIKIGTLQSHCKIFAGKTIEIEKIRGTENSLSIDQTRQEGDDEAMKKLDKAIDTARIAINVAQKKVDEHVAIFMENKELIVEIKNRLLKYKEANAQMPQAFVEQYKKFQDLQNLINLLKKELHLRTEEHQTLVSRKVEFQQDILDAKIISREPWHGHNEVKFKLTYPEKTLQIVPKEGQEASYYYLKFHEEDNSYSIANEPI